MACFDSIVKTLWGVAVLLVRVLGLGCRFGGETPSGGETVQTLESEPWGEPDETLAVVNGRRITRGEFYVRVLRRFGLMKLLSGLIKEELFLQEAERLGVRVETREVDAKVDEILDEMSQKAGGRDQLERELAREGLTMAALRRDYEREVSTQLLIGKVTQSRRKLTEEVLQEYYRRTYRYRRYVTRQIAYGFIDKETGRPDGSLKLEAFGKAQRVARKLREGADFGALARAESEDPVTAPRGGDLGEIHKDTNMKYPQFKRVILDLAVGEVSDPAENPDGGYHIFQVTEILDSESFADCRGKIVEEISTMEPDVREIEATLRDLQGRADVEVVNAPFFNFDAELMTVQSSGPEGAGRQAGTGVVVPATRSVAPLTPSAVTPSSVKSSTGLSQRPSGGGSQ